MACTRSPVRARLAPSVGVRHRSMPCRLPLRIRRSRSVAIRSPSSRLRAAPPRTSPRPTSSALTRLRDELGLVPVEYPTTRAAEASPEQRAADVQAAFADPDIAAVIASIGGEDQLCPRPPRCRGTRRKPEAVLRLQRQHESASVPLEPRRRLVPRRRSDGAARAARLAAPGDAAIARARALHERHIRARASRGIRTRRRTGPTRRTSGSSCRCHRPSPGPGTVRPHG